MDIAIKFWHMVEVKRMDFNEHHMMQVPRTEKETGDVQKKEELAEHVGINYPHTHVSTSRRFPLSLEGNRLSRKPHHNRWRWGLLGNNNPSSSTTTATTSSSSASYRKPPEYLAYLWLTFLVNNCCFALSLFFVTNYFLQFHFDYENRWEVQGKLLKNN